MKSTARVLKRCITWFTGPIESGKREGKLLPLGVDPAAESAWVDQVHRAMPAATDHVMDFGRIVSKVSVGSKGDNLALLLPIGLRHTRRGLPTQALRCRRTSRRKANILNKSALKEVKIHRDRNMSDAEGVSGNRASHCIRARGTYDRLGNLSYTDRGVRLE